MDWSLLAGFAAMAVVIEISPGPNLLLITRSVPTYGRIGAVVILVGFGFAYTMHGALAIYGVSALITTEPLLLLIIQIAGAGYVLYLGITSFTPLRKDDPSSDYIAESVNHLLVPDSDSLHVHSNQVAKEKATILSRVANRFGSTPDILLHSSSDGPCISGLFTCFRDGLFICALNPKITLFYLTVFPQFIQASTDTVSSYFFLVVTHIAICGLWIIVLVQILEYALKKADSRHFIEKLTRLSGVALIGLAVAIFSSAIQTV